MQSMIFIKNCHKRYLTKFLYRCPYAVQKVLASSSNILELQLTMYMALEMGIEKTHYVLATDTSNTGNSKD